MRNEASVRMNVLTTHYITQHLRAGFETHTSVTEQRVCEAGEAGVECTERGVTLLRAATL